MPEPFYPTDLTNSEWEIINPMLPLTKQRGRQRQVDLRQVINAIFYRADNGIKWRAMPENFPVWQTGYSYYCKWVKKGQWERINALLIGSLVLNVISFANVKNSTIQQLLLGCDTEGLLVNAIKGNVIASFPQVGGADQVWYNPGDHNFYLGATNSPNGPVLGIIDGSTDTLLQTISTFPGSKAVSADAVNNRIFVALTPNTTAPNCTNGCVGVYAVPEPSNTAGILVVGVIGGIGWLIKRKQILISN